MDGLTAWAILAVLLAVGGVTYIVVDVWRSGKKNLQQHMRRYYREHMTCVQINLREYIDVHEIIAFSVFRRAQGVHLYVTLRGGKEYSVGDYWLGNIIDFLYRVLDLSCEDYEYLDAMYDRAMSEELDNNESAGEGEEVL